ncbi:hypothetical protein E4U38_006375 [Claviceps purpurea]|nr:hypothetical protein E4U38_006375 [Claviceps purpurea]
MTTRLCSQHLVIRFAADDFLDGEPTGSKSDLDAAEEGPLILRRQSRFEIEEAETLRASRRQKA